jgi:solute carrier family 25 aspartate/glutamate transporter 12/13
LTLPTAGDFIMEKVAEKMDQAKEVVKESLLGTDVDPTLSIATRADFMRYAIKDEETEEYYMNEKEFVEAVAPEGEDYVGG